MKNYMLTLALILLLSLVFITSANPQRSNDVLRKELLDYLLEARRAQLLYSKRKELARQLRRYRTQHLNAEQSNGSDDDDDRKIYARRKAVGLGDNPYK